MRTAGCEGAGDQQTARGQYRLLAHRQQGHRVWIHGSGCTQGGAYATAGGIGIVQEKTKDFLIQSPV